jgi:hypothetical protein
MLWSGLAAHPDQDYAVPLRLSLRRGNRLRFQGFYELKLVTFFLRSML